MMDERTHLKRYCRDATLIWNIPYRNNDHHFKYQDNRTIISKGKCLKWTYRLSDYRVAKLSILYLTITAIFVSSMNATGQL